jgi:hypothetical protein
VLGALIALAALPVTYETGAIGSCESFVDLLKTMAVLVPSRPWEILFMSKTKRELKTEQPVWLTIFWCDRCGRAINRNEEKDHFHPEQCGGCKKFKRIDSDWGYCRSHTSVYGGRLMFERDTCSKRVEGEW